MKKAFLICAHEPCKSLMWTVSYLSSFEENIIIIHYDLKSDISDLIDLKSDNVFLINNRIDVTWGGVSQIHATIELLKFSLNFEFEYCFLISGSDVPSISNEAMNRILNKNYGYEFIHYQDERNSFIDPYERCNYSYPSVFFSRKNDALTKLAKKIHKLTRDVFFKNKIFLKNKKSVLYQICTKVPIGSL